MKRAILYIRVSTDEQADKGFSLRNQEDFLRKYCEINNIEIIHLFREDYSAKSFERPEWRKLLEFLKKNQGKVDLLLFTRWDRFSRNTADAYAMINKLNRIGVEPQAMENPLNLKIPENKMMLAVYLSLPQVENDRRALNVYNGMRRAKKEGRWMATAPKGYKNGRTENDRKVIVPDDDAKHVKWIFEEIAKGIHPAQVIWRMAKERGFDCSKNNCWSLVRNPVYCGKILIAKNDEEEAFVVKGIHEPIISEELFEQVQDILSGRKRNIKSMNTRRDELPLRGYLVCSKCGRNLTGSSSKGHGGTYFYYHCRYGCTERIRADKANTNFVELLSQVNYFKPVINLFFDVIENFFKNNGINKSQKQKALKEEMEKMNKRLMSAQNMMLDKSISADDYRGIKENLNTELNRLSREHLQLAFMETDYKKYVSFGRNIMQHLSEIYTKATLIAKQRIIGLTFPEKLKFVKEECRTFGAARVVSLICPLFKELQGQKKGSHDNFYHDSRWVDPLGLKPISYRTKIHSYCLI